MDKAIHSAPEIHRAIAYLQVAPEILADIQIASMSTSQSAGKRYLKWFKNIVLIGIGIPLMPILLPFFLIYLAFKFIVGAIEMSFKIFLRIIFPPLLMFDLWHLMTGQKK